MTASIANKYFIRFVDEDGESYSSIGRIEGFVSPNFLLIQFYNPHTYKPLHYRELIGVPHFENAMLFETFEQMQDEYRKVQQCDCEG